MFWDVARRPGNSCWWRAWYGRRCLAAHQRPHQRAGHPGPQPAHRSKGERRQSRAGHRPILAWLRCPRSFPA